MEQLSEGGSSSMLESLVVSFLPPTTTCPDDAAAYCSDIIISTAKWCSKMKRCPHFYPTIQPTHPTQPFHFIRSEAFLPLTREMEKYLIIAWQGGVKIHFFGNCIRPRQFIAINGKNLIYHLLNKNFGKFVKDLLNKISVNQTIKLLSSQTPTSNPWRFR